MTRAVLSIAIAVTALAPVACGDGGGTPGGSDGDTNDVLPLDPSNDLPDDCS